MNPRNVGGKHRQHIMMQFKIKVQREQERALLRQENALSKCLPLGCLEQLNQFCQTFELNAMMSKVH